MVFKGRLRCVSVSRCCSILLGIVETYIAALLGYILDLVIETPPNLLFREMACFAGCCMFFVFDQTEFFPFIFLFTVNGCEPGRSYNGCNTPSSLDVRSPKVTLIMILREGLRKEVQASNAVADVTVEVITQSFCFGICHYLVFHHCDYRLARRNDRCFLGVWFFIY